MTELDLAVLANRFYLNLPISNNPEVPQVSDKEYDELVKKYEAETGKSVKSLVDWDEADKIEREPIEPLIKEKFDPEEIREVIGDTYKDKPCRITYKYDGCAIEAEYTREGKLKRILGTPDESFGFIRTDKFWDFFPHQVTPGIHRIFGEVLVSAKQYGQLARNKANGLCNSKYLAEDIKREAIIRVYNMHFYDEGYNYERLLKELEKLPVITRIVEGKKVAVFDIAEALTADDVTGKPIITEHRGYDECEEQVLQVDGYVGYSADGPLGFKMYYTDYQDVTVKSIDWTYNWDNGSYIPTLTFEPVIINDKTIQRCATGGVPNLINRKMGVGSVVRIILSGGTIPKVEKVISEAEDFQYPVCECGYQLSEKDVLGSVLKCGNPECSLKLEVYRDEIRSHLGWESYEDWNEERTETAVFWKRNENKLQDVYDADPFFLIRLLKIDRFKPEDRVNELDEEELAFRAVDLVNKGVELPEIEEYVKNLLPEDKQFAVGEVSAVIWKYKETREEQYWYEAANKIQDLRKTDQPSEFQENLKKAVFKVYEEQSLEAFEALLTNFFKVSALQLKNAKVNMPSVLSAIKEYC